MDSLTQMDISSAMQTLATVLSTVLSFMVVFNLIYFRRRVPLYYAHALYQFRGNPLLCITSVTYWALSRCEHNTVYHWYPSTSQWRIQGRGPGAGSPLPPYFQTKLRRKEFLLFVISVIWKQLMYYLLYKAPIKHTYVCITAASHPECVNNKALVQQLERVGGLTYTIKICSKLWCEVKGRTRIWPFFRVSIIVNRRLHKVLQLKIHGVHNANGINECFGMPIQHVMQSSYQFGVNLVE